MRFGQQASKKKIDHDMQCLMQPSLVCVCVCKMNGCPGCLRCRELHFCRINLCDRSNTEWKGTFTMKLKLIATSKTNVSQYCIAIAGSRPVFLKTTLLAGKSRFSPGRCPLVSNLPASLSQYCPPWAAHHLGHCSGLLTQQWHQLASLLFLEHVTRCPASDP